MEASSKIDRNAELSHIACTGIHDGPPSLRWNLHEAHGPGLRSPLPRCQVLLR